MPGPLDGLIVVDASQVMPGSIASVLLADHGAEVIKVEPRGGAFYAHDLTRKSWERGKRSVELDIGDDADLKRLRALAATADVLIHSLEDAEARRLGLDRDSLAAANPGLVVCALTAYGHDTPHSGRPYGESLAAARLGVMAEMFSPYRAGPVYPGHPALHYGQAFLAVIDILAAVRARRENGDGQAVEATLLDAVLAQSPMYWWWHPDGLSFVKKKEPGKGTDYGYTRLVTTLFKCADGLFIQIHTGGPGGFKTTMDILGFGDRIKSVGGAEMAVPLEEDEYQAARVEIYDVFKQKPRDEWIRLFHAADVAALPVLEPAEVLLDDQVEFVGQRVEIADPDFGTIHQAAAAVRFGGLPTPQPAPAPSVGQHNGELEALLARPKRGAAKASRRVGHPLEGLRILDLSSFFACGYGARMLSDLGAEVIKVETPDGDQMRPLPNPFDACQRGKKAIAVNLKSPEGLAIIHKLVETADVLMHNLRPGKADKAGIGYEELAKINPNLIYAYLPGYGSTGPKSKLKSFAPLISGFTGLLYEGAGVGNPPVPSVYGNEDYNNGFLGAVGVLMAVENRYKTGHGDYIECPQVHSSLFSTSEHFLDADRKLVWGLRMDGGQMGFNALDRLYRTIDGFLCVSCREDGRFAALAGAVGRPELASDPRFADPRARTANDAELIAILEPFFAGLSSEAAFARLDAAGAACEIARETPWVPDMFLEDWPLASGRVFAQPDSMYGPIREIGFLNRLYGTPGIVKGPAPKLGEHTRDLLAELGYPQSEIEALVERKVVIAA